MYHGTVQVLQRKGKNQIIKRDDRVNNQLVDKLLDSIDLSSIKIGKHSSILDKLSNELSSEYLKKVEKFEPTEDEEISTLKNNKSKSLKNDKQINPYLEFENAPLRDDELYPEKQFLSENKEKEKLAIGSMELITKDSNKTIRNNYKNNDETNIDPKSSQDESVANYLSFEDILGLEEKRNKISGKLPSVVSEIIPPIEALPKGVKPALYQLLKAQPMPSHLPQYLNPIAGVKSIYDYDARRTPVNLPYIPKKLYNDAMGKVTMKDVLEEIKIQDNENRFNGNRNVFYTKMKSALEHKKKHGNHKKQFSSKKKHNQN